MEKFDTLGVAVIQSLSDKKQTGRELFDTTLKYISFSKPYLENEFFDINSSEEFFKTLEEIIIKAKNENKFYFLHFEIHGNENGIVLKNGDFINWKTLLEAVRNLNIYYKDQLSIYLAICHGNNIISSIESLNRSPFGFIIGSFFEIYNFDILNSFEKFYTIFFENYKIIEAFEEMKKVSIKSNFTLITSNYVIDTLIEMVKNTNDREKLVKMLNQTFNSSTDKIEESLAEEVKEKIIKAFDEHKIDKNYYLMSDLINTSGNSRLA